MNNLMKSLVKSLIVAILFVASSANALPTLFFDGDVSYSATTGELSVTSVLTATEDIASMPKLQGSSLEISANFSGGETSPFLAGGAFDEATISVFDGDANNLLSGDLVDLAMIGRIGRTSGRFTGTTSANSGSLADMFGSGILSSLAFNLVPGFSADMFEADFTSRIDGRITGEEVVAVPEPGILALLGVGVVLISISKRKSKQI